MEAPSGNQTTNETPLHAACEGNHCKIVEELVTKFPELLLVKDKIPYRGWYPIHTACAYGVSDKIVAIILLGIVKLCFDSPGLLNDISFLDSFGSPPLFITALCGNLPHASLFLHPILSSILLRFAPSLLYSGSSAVPTKSSVIHGAVVGNNIEILKGIMDTIPKIKVFLGVPCKLAATFVLKSLGLNLTDYSQIPMNLCEDTSKAVELISFNAVTVTHTPFDQMVMSPLAFAAALGRAEMVTALLDVGMKDTNNLALKFALFMKHSEIVINLLFHQKADMTTFKADDKNLLTFPVSPHISKLLLQCTEIDLQRNSLTEIPISLFQMPMLKGLNLSYNNLGTLPIGEKACDVSCKAAEWGWKCESLKSLDLSSNCIHTLPEAIWALPNLEYLDASHNGLREITSVKCYNAKLIKIDISYNSLTEFSPVLFLCEEVNLSFNKLTSLPMELWYSKSIKVLNVSGNRIKNVSFSNYAELMTVSFTTACTKVINDKTDMLVDQTGTVSSLLQLKIAHNQLHTFPSDLACFATHLQLLDISSNPITAIDISLLPPYLKTLVAKKCCITQFGSIMSNQEKETYKEHCVSLGIGSKCPHRRHTSLQHLNSLNLSNNKLTNMQFVGMDSANLLYPELTVLNLFANELCGSFSPLVKLQSNLFSLDLSGNLQLQLIPMELSLLYGTLFYLKLNNLPNLRDPPKEYHDLPVNILLSYMKLRMER